MVHLWSPEVVHRHPSDARLDRDHRRGAGALRTGVLLGSSGAAAAPGPRAAGWVRPADHAVGGAENEFLQVLGRARSRPEPQESALEPLSHSRLVTARSPPSHSRVVTAGWFERSNPGEDGGSSQAVNPSRVAPSRVAESGRRRSRVAGRNPSRVAAGRTAGRNPSRVADPALNRGRRGTEGAPRAHRARAAPRSGHGWRR